MANSPIINFSNLDFFQIKESFKTFLRNRGDMQDFDFDGSGWSYLLDLLAYNTAYNSFYLNMIGNEMFLDTAVIRESILSKAKMLGYLPRSKRAARADIEVRAYIDSGSPSQFYIPKETTFSGVGTDGKTYEFVIPGSKTLYYLHPNGSSDWYHDDTGSYFKTNLELIQGVRLSHRFTVTSNEDQRFIIPNDDVDIDTVNVWVQESATNRNLHIFKRITNITDVDADSRVFYLQYAENGKVEVYFGDGIISAGFYLDSNDNMVINGLAPGNVVVVEYVVTSGELANGIKKFSLVSGLGIVTPSSLNAVVGPATTLTQATGGEAIESNRSIKYFAPVSYEMQNRAVTKSDFEYIIKRDYPRIDTVSVWGGEDNDPPQYGRVFIAMKPADGYILEDDDKDYIINSLIRPRCVVTQDPVIVDADYLYITINTVAKYLYLQTNKSAGEILAAIKDKILEFADTELNKFNVGVEHSKFVELVDGADQSIKSNITNFGVKKIIYPTIGTSNTWTIDFLNPIKVFDEHSLNGKSVYSSPFLYTNNKDACFFAEKEFQSNILCLFWYNVNYNRVESVGEYGTINYDTGKITIDQPFTPLGWTSANLTRIEFYAKPMSEDIYTTRNVITVIDENDITINVFEST